MGADVLIIEEAAYVDLRLFYEVIMPLLEMSNTVMIMISTPTNTFSFFTKLKTVKDENGVLIFLSYTVDLVCSRCKGGEHPEKCRHLIHLLPRWKSEDKMKLAELIMQDQVTTLLRESRGLVIDDTTSYFEKDEIDELLKSEPWTPRAGAGPRYVLVTIDPNTRKGESSSNMALFAMTLDGGYYTVSQQDGREVHDVSADRELQEVFGRIAGAVQELRGSLSHPGDPHPVRLDRRDVRRQVLLHLRQEGQEEQERQQHRVVRSLREHAIEHPDQQVVVVRLSLVAVSDDLGNPLEPLSVEVFEPDLDPVDVVPEHVGGSAPEEPVERVSILAHGLDRPSAHLSDSSLSSRRYAVWTATRRGVSRPLSFH